MRFKAVPVYLLISLLRNLIGGFRIAFWLPVSRTAFRVSPVDYAVLAIFNLLVWVLGSAVRIGTAGGFNAAALPAMLAIIPLMLLLCLVLSRLFRDDTLLLSFAVMLASTDLLFEVVGTAIFAAFDGPWADAAPILQLGAFALYVGWAILIVIRTQVVLVPWHTPRSRFAALLLAAMVLAMAYTPRDDPWIAVESGQDDLDVDPGLMHEEIFHVQGSMLGRDLAQLAPERAGLADLYFLGVAPFARQDTFMRELSVVKKLMDEHFDTGTRSLALVNHARTVGAVPMATVTNLRMALAHLGSVMNTSEDVLFLFLTTHGNLQQELAFEFPPLRLQQLTPTALARALADSGIKWKVIVLSACYSGGYIEPLRDDNTLIITASDATHSSFGCEPESEFTWFSRAFFDEALRDQARRRTYSLLEAFEKARSTVAAREAEKNFEPSNPQLFVGAAMRDKLKSMEDRLVRSAPPGTEAAPGNRV